MYTDWLLGNPTGVPAVIVRDVRCLLLVHTNHALLWVCGSDHKFHTQILVCVDRIMFLLGTLVVVAQNFDVGKLF